MKKTLLALVLILSFSASALAFDNGDFQVWHNDSLIWKVNKDWKMVFDQEFRMGDDGGNFYYEHSDLSANYSGIAHWLDVGFGFRQGYLKKSGEWKSESQPNLLATIKLEVAKFEINDRHRFEYRELEDNDDGWNYRNKLTIGLPIKFTRLKIQPYISDEFFLNIDKGLLDQNRLYGGFYLQLLKNLKGEIYYMWLTTKKSGQRWIDSNVLGTKLTLSF